MALTPQKLSGPKTGSDPVLNGITVSDYDDVVTPPAPGGGVSDLITKRSDTISIDGAGLEAVTITSQPAIGKATTAGLGNIHVDLRDVMTDNPPESLSIGLDITRNGVMTSETLTVPVKFGYNLRGTPTGLFANLERDANNRVIVEPGENHRKVYVRAAGLTLAQISARHGGANVNGAFFRDTLAKDAGGVDQAFYYGETEAFALDPEAADVCWSAITRSEGEASNWLLLEDGEIYDPAISGGTSGHFGEGDLHPTLVTGEGGVNRPIADDGNFDVPIYSGVIRGVEYLRDTDNDSAEHATYSDVNFLIIDNVKTNMEILARGLDSFLATMVTISDLFSYETYRTKPIGTNTSWGGHRDRYQASYMTKAQNLMVMGGLLCNSGYEHGYMYDGNFEAPFLSVHPQNVYSHTGYYDRAYDLQTWGVMWANPAYVGHQGRGGQCAYENAYALCNVGMNMGAGKNDTQNFGTGVTGLFAGTTSYCISGAMVDTHNKGSIDTTSGTFLGVDNNSQDVGVIDTLFANQGDIGDDPAGRSNGDIPASGFWFNGSSTGKIITNGSSGRGTLRGGATVDCINQGWPGIADENNTGLQAAIATATLRGFGADWLGGAPTGFQVIDAIKADPDPVAKAREFWEWCRTRAGMGIGSDRTVAEVCYFRQHPSGHTPGNFHIHLDWSTMDRPGTVAGDSIALEGRTAIDCVDTPDKNTLADLILDGGSYNKSGAKTVFTGDVLGGGTIITDYAGQAFFGDCIIDAQLEVDCRGGRFAVTGAMSGPMSATVSRHGQFLVYDGGSVTIDSGQTLSLKGGHCKVGFDGDGGAAGILTFAAGSTLKVSPYVRATTAFFDAKNGAFWKFGFDVLASVSGVTGRAEFHRGAKNVNGSTWFGDLNGVLQANDVISGEYFKAEYDSAHLSSIPTTDDIATVGVIENIEWPKIREVRSGRFGVNQPSVSSTLSLAGALEIDLRALDGAATETIVDVDTLTGTFSGVTALGIGDRDMTVTVDNAAGTVAFAVTTGGTGQITLA